MPPNPVTGAGRPAKIKDPERWDLRVPSAVRRKAAARAARAGRELPDVMRDLLADYAAGAIAPVVRQPEERTP